MSEKRLTPRANWIVPFAIIFMAGFSTTHAEEVTVARPPTQTITLNKGFSTTIRVASHFKTIFIANPDIVDVLVRTDREATLVPKMQGSTNVDILDENTMLVSSINVIVTANKILAGRTLVYDHPSLTSFTTYYCGSVACDYVEESITKEPAPVRTDERREVVITGGGSAARPGSVNVQP